MFLAVPLATIFLMMAQMGPNMQQTIIMCKQTVINVFSVNFLLLTDIWTLQNVLIIMQWKWHADQTEFVDYGKRISRFATFTVSVWENTRSVRKVSTHFEYFQNRSRALYATWQPVTGYLTAHEYSVLRWRRVMPLWLSQIIFVQ